ncbi:hypothetical protein QVD17_09913 [Tagetes erecta]|uniref:Uncharacterized protein n=1 Tax=Tagetes erecta TaxID=13708 RepID=A0AAD8P5G8_TARER|nr:hypothetical protein QVD17_09913 [Tagetes erecta]
MFLESGTVFVDTLNPFVAVYSIVTTGSLWLETVTFMFEVWRVFVQFTTNKGINEKQMIRFDIFHGLIVVVYATLLGNSLVKFVEVTCRG